VPTAGTAAPARGGARTAVAALAFAVALGAGLLLAGCEDDGGNVLPGLRDAAAGVSRDGAADGRGAVDGGAGG
jgi:hypothetical protein